jgi:hypothetical protein
MVGLLAVSGFAVAQAAMENRSLAISGQPGQAPVIQVKGKSYVDVEALARITNGSLSFKGTQITLTLPGSAPSGAAATPPASEALEIALSKDFSKAGIEELAVIRDWRTALVSAVRNGIPVTDESDTGYRAQAAKDLKLASIAASTEADHSAYQLLSNEVSIMQRFGSEIMAAHDDMRNISPDALKADPLEQQTLNCSRSLSAMLAKGEYQDDGTCH